MKEFRCWYRIIHDLRINKERLVKEQLFSLVIFVTFSMGIAIASHLNRSISQTYAVRIWDRFQCEDRIGDDLKNYIQAPENDNDDCRVSVTSGTNTGEESPTLTFYMYWQRSSSTLRRYVHNCNSDESHLNIILKCKISDTASWHEMCLVDGNCVKQGTFCGMEKDYGRCMCKEGYRVDSSRRKCIKVNVLLGGHCDHNENCGELNTWCRGNRCKCRDAYTESNGFCITGNIKLGETCFRDMQCGQSKICNKAKCSCRAGYVQIENICVKGRKTLGSSCQYHQQCTETPKASLCLGNTSHYRCSCDMGFVEKNQSCIENEMHRSDQKSNGNKGTLVVGSGISGLFVGATFIAILFGVYNKRQKQIYHMQNSHQLSDERQGNCSTTIYSDPAENTESGSKPGVFPTRILNKEPLNRKKYQSRGDCGQSIYNHLHEKDKTENNLEMDYDHVKFTQSTARQTGSVDVCMTVNVHDPKRPSTCIYELQQVFEHKNHVSDI